jgi:DNA-binding MarR family transcriptional regulator
MVDEHNSRAHVFKKERREKMNITQDQLNGANELWHRLVQATYKGAFAAADEQLKKLTFLEISILAFVFKKPDIILKDILELTGIPNSSLTSIIDRLERRGYLQRILSQRDRRSYGLELTELGQEVHQMHLDFEGQLYRRVLLALDSPEERDTFLRLFTKVLDALSEPDQPMP